MIICDGITVPFAPVVPEFLAKRLFLHFTCELSARECELAGAAFLAVAEMMKSDPDAPATTWAHVLFINRDEIRLKNDVVGQYVPLIIYPLHRWQSNLGEDRILIALIEEMCHCFYSICDEDQVDLKNAKALSYLGMELRKNGQLVNPG